MSIRPCIGWLAMALVTFNMFAANETSDQARAAFESPSRHYSNGPLWVWNDMLTEDQIRDTLRDLARQHVKQVWVHPRPGLMTPYLSKEWFHLWKIALREAEKLDMNVWIYDENSYPSGFAGGLVPEAMPESRGQGLAFLESRTSPKWDANTVAVYRLDQQPGNTSAQSSEGLDVQTTFEDVTPRIKAGERLPDATYLVASVKWAETRPWHGGRFYVNLLSPGVTEKFMELTYGPYKEELGGYFGKRIPGIFTDEPNIQPVWGTLPWSETICAEFQKRWGYNLLDHLPSLDRSVGDYRKVRHNYFQVLHELFVERWAKPNHDYCAANNLEWTGHYWDHDWPECLRVPDNMAMYAWHQRPSIDCLMNQYREDTDAQFGNVRMVRELSSVANQLGIKRTLCETYGAAGWDLRFEDMKRIGDWLQVLGVNTINEHLSYVTIRGARKRDHPQSFSYHEPWWNAYHVCADYFARLSAALSYGEQVNSVLVLEPTTTAWMYQENPDRLKEIGKSFFDLLMALEAAQIEYDLVSEDILARFGKPGTEMMQAPGESPKAASLKVGRREYRTIVIPPCTENLNHETRQLLDKVAVTRLASGSMPSRIDGALAGEGQNDSIRTNATKWVKATISRLSELQTAAPVLIKRSPGDKGILFHMRRELADGQLLFLVNTSIEHPSRAEVFSTIPGVEEWDLQTGKTKPYPFMQQPTRIRAQVTLPPSGSLLLLFNNKAVPFSPPTEVADVVPPAGEMTIKRLAENVLTLDYVSVTVGAESLSNVYFRRAADFVWEKHGFEKDPWDGAVQFKDELITRRFPPQSGFEATYSFNMKDMGNAAPRRLSVVVERPDLYSITFNGQKVNPSGEWWLDKAFGRIEVATLARPGENRLTIKAAPMTMMHELEPAYVVGDFSLESGASGFAITKDHAIRLGHAKPRNRHATNPEDTMWLSAGVGFRRNLEDRAPWLLFDLGSPAEISALKIWNYNESVQRDCTARGARVVRVKTGDSEASQPVLLGEFTLAPGDTNGLAQILPAQSTAARYIRFEFVSNHNGVTYPFEGKGGARENDFAFVGLAEVQFLDKQGHAINDVRVADSSSEIPLHRRLAKHLVDGSGLEEGFEGWNAQGFPFYGNAVAYTQRFDVSKPSGRYVVGLPSWRGSVARVTVNGKAAGWITAPPFECDVTKLIKRGSNMVEISVTGTLKNTLGPHHQSPEPGSAWPTKFKDAPEQGPPAGSSYSTLAYGLFEPMVLQNLR